MCEGLTRRAVAGVLEDAAGFAYERASSINAAVPDALSFAPGLRPLLSRCARTTISDDDRPGATATTLTKCSRPRPATSASNASRSVRKP